jgi:hypothetical protein
MGPFRIMEVVPLNNTYRIQDVREVANNERTAHISELVPFERSLVKDMEVLASLDDDEWIIDRVVDHEYVGKSIANIKVFWKGFRDPSWINAEKLSPVHCTPYRDYLTSKQLLSKGGV